MAHGGWRVTVRNAGTISPLFVARVLETTAGDVSGLLIVGSGSLARIAGATVSSGRKIVVQGAMGMAAAVALGFSRSSGRPTIVLEGDGNFLMGAPVCHWMAAISSPTLHVVVCNGQYLTSGGQALPVNAEYIAHGRKVDKPEEFIQQVREWSAESRYYRLLFVMTPIIKVGRLSRPRRSLMQQCLSIRKISRAEA